MTRYDKYARSKKGLARTKRYKNKNRYKIKAQNQAFYLYKDIKECSIKGCNIKAERHHPNYKKKSIIWLCRKHHLEIHGKVRGDCNCGKPHHAKGLCKAHYAQKFRKEQGW